MKRILLCLVLAACLGGVADAHPRQTPGARRSVAAGKHIDLSYIAPYLSVNNGRRAWALRCVANAKGGVALTTKITRCVLTTKLGDRLSAPVALFPGTHAETATVGTTRNSPAASFCITGQALYQSGGSITNSHCYLY